MSVEISVGEAWTIDRPRPLFRAPLSNDVSLYRGFYRSHFVVTADDQRFGIAADEEGQPPISVVVGWEALIR